MKKIIVWVLMSVFFGNIVGCFLLSSFVQDLIQQEMREYIAQKLTDDELIMIPASQMAGVQWLEEGHEFSLNHEMYDVVRIKIVNNQKCYYCICDNRENHFMDLMNKEHKNDKNKQLKNIDITQFFQVITKRNFIAFSPICILSHYNFSIIEFYAAVKTPPPWRVC